MIDPTSAGPTLVDLDLGRIVPNARQPRRRLDEAALADLTRSVATDGVVQPIVVRDAGDGTYELIAGERRWRAAQAAGLRTIPAVIRRADDRGSLLLAIVENVVREDLNSIEVARGYGALADEFGLSTTEIAERVGKSRVTVTNTLRLLELPDDVLAMVEEGTLTEGHGRAILQAESHEARRAIARRAAADGLSVRQTEALARIAGRARAKRLPRGGPGWLDTDVANDAVDACFRAFGLPARVAAAGKGCRLELTVSSPEELARLADRLEAVAGLAETHIL
jgi:ParB family chromosome partitioning protein